MKYPPDAVYATMNLCKFFRSTYEIFHNNSLPSMAKIKERKEIYYMIRHPTPRPRARIEKLRIPYWCFGFSSVASLVDV